MKTRPLYPLTPDRGHTPLTRSLGWLTKTRLVYALAFFSLLAVQGLTDPDYFWHLRTGEYIITNGSLPSGDIFSWSALGQKWILHEWLFEVLLYGAFALGGSLAVKGMTAAIGLLAIAVVANTASRLTRNPAAAGIATCFGFVAFCSGIVPRPQLFTYLFLAIYAWKLLDFKYQRKLPELWLLPLVMIAWVNIHGGYVVGVLFIVLFVFCEWLVQRWDRSEASIARGKELRTVALIAGMTILATLVNPWFIEHWLYPFQVLGMSANAVISEWQSPDFHSPLSQAFLLLAIISVSAGLLTDRRPDITEIVIPTFFAVNAFISQRHIPIAVLMMIPFLAIALNDGAIDRVVRVWRDTAIARAYARRLAAGSDLGEKEIPLNWAILTLAACGLAIASPRFQEAQQQRLERILPVRAVDFVLANGIAGRMFNDYTYGGYLLYRMSPEQKVFIDGRADLYGDQFIADYVQVNHGKAEWKKKFEKLDVDFAIVSTDAPIRQLLLTEGTFREVYADVNHSVLVRK
jgi:hypothetical protein